MRILLASPRDSWNEGVAAPLRGGGHVVTLVDSWPAARDALFEAGFDIAVVGLVPEGVGMAAAVASLRQAGGDVHLLVLASADREADRIAALNAGADGCIGAHSSIAEVVAQVRSWVRRQIGAASNRVRHGPLSFDTAERMAYLDEQPLRLTPRELSLLEALLQRAGRYVSKHQLAGRMFAQGDDVSESAIEVCVSRLRRKIGDGPVRIATLRGLGYSLERV